MSRKPDEMAVFCRVMELGSFSAAGDDLGLSPSAVSKLVSRIEDRLGVKLLARTTRSLALTNEGEIYLRRSEEILRAIADAEAEVSADSAEPAGTLRVNTGPTFGRHKLMRELAEFVDRYPKIDLRLEITDRVVDLAAERVDVAIRAGDLMDSRLISRRLLRTPRIVCASPEYIQRFGTPTVPADLRHHRCLLISGVQTLKNWSFQLPDSKIVLAIEASAQSDNADIVRDMAVEGLGIANLVGFTIAEDLAAGRLVQLLARYSTIDHTIMQAVMLPERQKSPRVRAFVDFLVEKFAER